MREDSRIRAEHRNAHFRAVASVLVGLALVAANPGARADEGDEPVRFAYRGPAGCEDEASFLEHVRQRTTRMREPHAGEAARVFTVVVEGRGPSRGRLTIDSPDGGHAERVVNGEACDEVTDALALAAALAIDPNAVIAPRPTAPKPAPPPLPPPAPSASPPPPIPHAPPPPSPMSRVDVAFGIEAAGSTLAGPSFGFGGAAFAEIGAHFANGIWPSLRAGASFVTAGDTTTDIGTAHFSRWIGVVEGCPTRASWAWIQAFACVRFDAGELRATGAGVQFPQKADPAWFALGAMAHLRLRPHGPVFVELEGGPLFPLGHPRFFFEPDVEVYKAPIVGAETGVSVGFELP